jgi:hypothetical protein
LAEATATTVGVLGLLTWRPNHNAGGVVCSAATSARVEYCSLPCIKNDVIRQSLAGARDYFDCYRYTKLTVGHNDLRSCEIEALLHSNKTTLPVRITSLLASGKHQYEG